MAKLDDDITYELFKNLEQDPHLSQRALSNILGISLGKVNYCLKALAAKGWLKAENFKKSPNKFGYAYILTPSGLEAKARITTRFLRRKMDEYEKLKVEIENLRREVENYIPADQCTSRKETTTP